MLAGGADEKHFKIRDRQCRFDSTSKYGGHGGASVVKALPPSWSRRSVDGLWDTTLKIKRPRNNEGNVLITKLDQELPELVSVKPKDKDGSVVAELSGGHTFSLSAQLASECLMKSVRRDKACSEVIVTTYSLQGITWIASEEWNLSEQSSSTYEDSVMYSVCQVKEHANLRRAPVGMGLCRFGCAKCSKGRGCKSWASVSGVRRKRFKEEVACQINPALGLQAPPPTDDIDCGIGHQAGSEMWPWSEDAPEEVVGMRCSQPQRSSSCSDISRATSASNLEVSETVGNVVFDEWVVV
mmetsp:Transcript_114113/g.285479  ORF Transcript_114113/g.285479 Transcript_114113/m.285479 type:complete len:297 (+) Transcript_114113:92-982(+)